ncbi:MAG TPA: RsmG family class I SAM-dependent methyltransferase [Vicinamibacterales bacterium]|nr:RsmG family class I SAM-dependent methyltransferase [Vicinamibacterales bacterium]
MAPPPRYLPKIEAYFDLLSKWNRRINLTSLPLDPPSDEAIDRLVIEPLVAAGQVRPADRLCVDLGSGGGSPGVPLHLATPWVRLVLVEVKVRKSAFLREVARQLGLGTVEVENSRFEELLARSDLLEAADLVTFRAVRPDRALWNTVQAFLKPGGRALWFTSGGSLPAFEIPMLSMVAKVSLVRATGSELVVLEKK